MPIEIFFTKTSSDRKKSPPFENERKAIAYLKRKKFSWEEAISCWKNPEGIMAYLLNGYHPDEKKVLDLCEVEFPT